MSKKRIIAIIVGGLLACAGIIAAIVGGVFLLTRPVADAGGDYLAAIRASDFETVYAMSAPNVQDEMGSVAGIEGFFVRNNFSPQSWSFNSRSVENNTGSLRGSATLAIGIKVDLEMDFVKIDGEWRLTRIFFRDQ